MFEKRGERKAKLQTMKGVDFFNSVEHLEPKCPKCKTKIEWGVSTEWNDSKDAHVCKTCGSVLK